MSYRLSDPNRPRCKAEGCERGVLTDGYCVIHCGPRCKAEGCERGVFAKGYCQSHYSNQQNEKTMEKNKHEGNLCKVDGCERGVLTDGYCKKHYNYQRKKKTEERNKTLGNLCKVDGCERGVLTKGYCELHYEYQRKRKNEKDSSRQKCKVEECTRSSVVKGFCESHYGTVNLHKYKEKIFSILGGKTCVECGFSDERALAFDHIHDDGNLDRNFNKTSLSLPKYARNIELTKNKLQVMCFNCNSIKRYISGDLSKKKRNSASSIYSKKKKDELYVILGGKTCVECGFSDERALAFDHIHDDGVQERKQNKSRQLRYSYYTKNPQIAKQRLQVLCMNCNKIKIYNTKYYFQNWIRKNQKR